MSINEGLAVAIALAGVITSYFFKPLQAFQDWRRTTKDLARADVDFARRVVEYTSAEGAHAYVTQAMFQVLSSDPKMSINEGHYLLSFAHGPKTAMDQFKLCREILFFDDAASPARLKYRPSHKGKTRRFAKKALWATGYAVTYSLGFAPLLLISFEKLSKGFGLATFLFTALIFLPLAYFSLREGHKIKTAEAVMKSQKISLNMKAGANKDQPPSLPEESRAEAAVTPS